MHFHNKKLIVQIDYLSNQIIEFLKLKLTLPTLIKVIPFIFDLNAGTSKIGKVILYVMNMISLLFFSFLFFFLSASSTV